MRIPVLLLSAFLLAAPFATSAQDAATPAPAKVLTDAEKAAIEDVVRDYITTKHPEILVQGMKELQRREQETAENKSKEAVAGFKDKIFNDPTSPVGGNAKGDVMMVEFFDYQCGYCKLSEEAIEKLMKDDKNVKLIYKDFPILGPTSVTATKAALAAVKQGKYIKMHDALMAKKDHLTDDMVYQIAKEAGLDVDKLKKDMADESVTKIVDANLKLGSDIGVRGTPMFIIGTQIYPGALQYEQLKKAVDDARAAAKK